MENKSLPVHRFLRKEVYDFHEHLVSLLDLQPNDKVLDLGCGSGATLMHLADRISQHGMLAGLDVDQGSITECRGLLGTAPVELIRHDLADAMPFIDGAFTKIVCHNVLECLPDKAVFLAECFRVLGPAGTMVLSHSDFDALVFNSSLVDLTRRLVHCYADWKQAWMTTSDPMMGRKLAGLVGQSAFRLDCTQGYTVVSPELAAASPGGAFLTGVLAAARKGGGFAEEDLVEWERDQRDLANRGEFFFAVTNFIVVATK